MQTASTLELKFERAEIKGELAKEIVSRIETEDNFGEISTDFQDFFDNDIPTVMAVVVKNRLYRKWDYVTLQTELDEGLEPNGYIALFCIGNTVQFDVLISAEGKIAPEAITAETEHMEEARMDMI